MTFPIDTEKLCNKILHSFMIKALNKSSIEGMYLNMIKTICNKSTPNIIPRGKKVKTFPLRSGKRQGCPPSPLLSNTVLEVINMAIRGEKVMKGIQFGKEEVKLSLYADDMILYIKNQKDEKQETTGANQRIW